MAPRSGTGAGIATAGGEGLATDQAGAGRRARQLQASASSGTRPGGSAAMAPSSGTGAGIATAGGEGLATDQAGASLAPGQESRSSRKRTGGETGVFALCLLPMSYFKKMLQIIDLYDFY